jgi:hypothetical protein
METSMLTHPTHERLITLGLSGMAKAFEEQRRSPDLDALSFEERLGLLVDREAAERDTKRLTTRLKFAALRQSACVCQSALDASVNGTIEMQTAAMDIADYLKQGGQTAGHRELWRLLRTIFKETGDTDELID